MLTNDLNAHIEDLEAHFAQARTLGTGQLIARAHRARSLTLWDGLVRFRRWLGLTADRSKAAYFGALNRSIREAPRAI